MPKCELCGLDLTVITWSHLQYVHGITPEDYQRKFPEALKLEEE